MKDNLAYLRHVLEAIDKINNYLNGFDFEKFSKNNLVFDGVVRELEIIGEAANKISDEFQEAHQEIPWRQMTGIRNMLIHEYFDIDQKIIWDTCQKDLPELKETIEKLSS